MTDGMRSHQTAVEIAVKVGATATIQTTVDDGAPTLEITWGSVTVWVSPHAASEGHPITACDVDRARDLATQAIAYAAAMEALWTTQTSAPAPERTGVPA